MEKVFENTVCNLSIMSFIGWAKPMKTVKMEKDKDIFFSKFADGWDEQWCKTVKPRKEEVRIDNNLTVIDILKCVGNLGFVNKSLSYTMLKGDGDIWRYLLKKCFKLKRDYLLGSKKKVLEKVWKVVLGYEDYMLKERMMTLMGVLVNIKSWHFDMLSFHMSGKVKEEKSLKRVKKMNKMYEINWEKSKLRKIFKIMSNDSHYRIRLLDKYVSAIKKYDKDKARHYEFGEKVYIFYQQIWYPGKYVAIDNYLKKNGKKSFMHMVQCDCDHEGQLSKGWDRYVCRGPLSIDIDEEEIHSIMVKEKKNRGLVENWIMERTLERLDNLELIGGQGNNIWASLVSCECEKCRKDTKGKVYLK
mgnify:CR=1 FL=1